MQSFLVNFALVLFTVLQAAIFIRVLLSWLPMIPHNRFIEILHEITEPVLAPMRRVIPSIGFIDISPMVTLILLQLFQQLLLSSLNSP